MSDKYRDGQTNAELAKMLRDFIASPSSIGYDLGGFCLMDHAEQVAEALEASEGNQMTTTTDDPLAEARRALADIGERFNKLAVENKRLEERVELHCKRGADYFADTNALLKRALEAEKLAAANQEAADVIAALEERGFYIQAFLAGAGITLPAKAEQGDGDELFNPEALRKAAVDRPDHPYLAGPDEPCPFEESEPAPAEGVEYFFIEGGSGIEWSIHHRLANGRSTMVFIAMGNHSVGYERATNVCAYLNGTSAIHQQLQAAREELDSLRRDRQAWDAVRRWKLELTTLFDDKVWQAWRETNECGHESERHADPRDAVLALAEQLEGGM